MLVECQVEDTNCKLTRLLSLGVRRVWLRGCGLVQHCARIDAEVTTAAIGVSDTTQHLLDMSAAAGKAGLQTFLALDSSAHGGLRPEDERQIA